MRAKILSIRGNGTKKYWRDGISTSVWTLCFILIWELRTLFILKISDPNTVDSVCEYIPLAWNLVHGHGFSMSPCAPYEPTAFRTPGYPLFLSLFYIPWMDFPNITFVIQSALEGIAAWFIYRITFVLSDKSAATSRIAALLFLLYPFSLITPSILGREALYLPIFLGGFYLFLKALEKPNPYRLIWTGAAFGLAVYIREDALLHFFVVLAIWGILVCRKSKPLAIKGMGMMLCAFAIMLSPWIIRNAITFHKFIPTSTISFYPLLARGNLDLESTQGKTLLAISDPNDLRPLREANLTLDYNRYLHGPSESRGWPYDYYRTLFWTNLKANPLLYPSLVAKRFLHYLFSSRIGELPEPLSENKFVRGMPIKVLLILLHAAIVVFGLWGFSASRSTSFLVLPVLWPYLAIATLGHPLHHYAFPGFALLFVGVALWINQRLQRDAFRVGEDLAQG